MENNLRRHSVSAKSIVNKLGIWLVLIVLMVISSLLNKNFLTVSNLFNILRQSCVILLVAYAEAILIISGSIDLSAGSTLCFAGIAAIPVYVATNSIFIAILAAIVACIFLYVISGGFVAYLNVPPFIATLAMMTMARGAVKVYTKGITLTKTGENFRLMGQGYIGPIPIPVVVMLVATLILWIILSKTKFGRNLYAVGGNVDAARASGINIPRYRMFSFILAGAFVGLAGFMLASRTNAGSPMAGSGYEGQGISAAIIGGVGFSGGTGTVFGVLAGAFVMGVISNILNLVGVDSYVQEVINGAIILAAVVLDIWTKKKSMRS